MFDSRVDTYKHIQVVQNLLGKMISDLQRRQKDHDQSKLQTPEVEYFDKYTPKLASSTYGSNEYKQFLSEMKPALDHHYAKNSHHPEHYGEGIKGMNLLDLVEMLCDWKAATMRHNDGNIHKSIEMNQKRFGYTDELKQILINSLLFIEDSQLQKNENLESVINAYMKDGVCSVTSCKLVPLSESLSEWHEALYVKLHYTIQSLSATAVTLTISPFMAEVCKLKSQKVPGNYYAGTMGQWSVYQDSDVSDGHVLIETSMGKAILMISNIDELKKACSG